MKELTATGTLPGAIESAPLRRHRVRRRAGRCRAEDAYAYNKALEIRLEFNDRHSAAGTYHQLGLVAQLQRSFALAEEAYKKALKIYGELNDRYEQAGTYHQLGRVAEDLRRLAEAGDSYKKALDIYVEFNDEDSVRIVLRSLARLYRATGAMSIPDAIATIFKIEAEQAAELLKQLGEADPPGAQS